MLLSAKLAYDFGRKAQKGGERCYANGQVQILQGSPSSIKARVGGAYGFTVSLAFEDETLFTKCGCQDCERTGACKHVWATILAADARGYLRQAASAKDVFLELDDFDVLDEDEPKPASVATAPVVVQPLPATKPAASKPAAPKPVNLPPPPPPPPKWRQQITDIYGNHLHAMVQRESWPVDRELIYIVETQRVPVQGGIVLSLESREPKADGTWKASKRVNVKHSQIAYLPLAEDREILSMLTGCKSYYGWGYGGAYDSIPEHCELKLPLAKKIMPMLASTGRCYLLTTNIEEDVAATQKPIQWDQAGPWRFELQMRRAHSGGWQVNGVLRRAGEQMELSLPVQITENGFVFTHERVALLAEDAPFQWLSYLRNQGTIQAPEGDRDDLLATLLCSRGLPPLEVPEELSYERVSCAPVPCFRVRPGNGNEENARLKADLSFDYEGRTVPHGEKSNGWYDAANRRLLPRNLEAETSAANLLSDFGIKYQPSGYYDMKPAWHIAQTKLPRIVRALVEEGWRVEAEGKLFRRPGAFRMEVSSGVDWFELRGEVQYGDNTAKLPELLQALRRGENIVVLGNGEYGIVPEEWLRRFGPVAGMGTAVNGHLRFGRSQVGLLDALLATQPEAGCDETFARVRQELNSFQGIQAAEQPASFTGQLRDYQREGLGWMHFLRRFSFGGCLADDMGVGKTAQVLALLQSRRESTNAKSTVRPSLVVVPKSLVFNWKLEAERFTPQLRVLDYTGSTRSSASFTDFDIVLTTYGTLRRDVLVLKEMEFDYIVLDEAQAVKNANSESAKAVRLLRGQNRLALSGTPIENHLGELWTLFEFLNPGMLGAASAFREVSGSIRNPNEDARRLLAGALRPFILRRTKEQVARELPPKTEQTIYCEMEPPQRKLYDELLQHYRNSLLKRIESEGMEKSKIQVLEALLRLRQAACHPGLLDPKRKPEPSAKLDVLLARITEVIEEGHKALVFSQFTSLLQIVRERLDKDKIDYDYLDGSTHDRQSRVEHFQNDPDCRLFLISLKAGGMGLNLTAAEYVFLLDPWWNPAVEAQAMDRAHRIGQTHQVFAYRLIAKGTVEEKVLELQKSKRDLASAIISADNSVIRNLQREDLELLLS